MLGAYIVMFPRKQVRVLLFYFIMEVPAIVVIGLWALTQFVSGAGSLGARTSETGGVAYMAHVGGFVSGVLGGADLARHLGTAAAAWSRRGPPVIRLRAAPRRARARGSGG